MSKDERSLDELLGCIDTGESGAVLFEEFSKDDNVSNAIVNKKREPIKLTLKNWAVIGVASVLILIASALTIIYAQSMDYLPFRGSSGDIVNESNSLSAESSANKNGLGGIYIDGTGRFESDPQINQEASSDYSTAGSSLQNINMLQLNEENKQDWDSVGGDNYADATE